MRRTERTVRKQVARGSGALLGREDTFRELVDAEARLYSEEEQGGEEGERGLLKKLAAQVSYGRDMGRRATGRGDEWS